MTKGRHDMDGAGAVDRRAFLRGGAKLLGDFATGVTEFFAAADAALELAHRPDFAVDAVRTITVGTLRNLRARNICSPPAPGGVR